MITKARAYPDHTFADRARAVANSVRVLWEIPGPKDTAIAWLTCYSVDGQVCLVETYQDSGWDVFTSLGKNDIDATVEDALNRLL